MSNTDITFVPITRLRNGTLIRHARSTERDTRTACNMVMDMDVVEGHHYTNMALQCQKCAAL